FVGWCWVFGRDEMGIPDRFMPPRPAVRSPDDPQAETGGRSDRAGDRSEHAGGGSEDVNPPAKTVSSGENRDQGEHSRLPLVSSECGPAVRVSGYLSGSLGLGAAARAYAQALEAAGVAVSTTTVPLHHLSLPEGLETGYGEHGFRDVLRDHPHSNFEILA